MSSSPLPAPRRRPPARRPSRRTASSGSALYVLAAFVLVSLCRVDHRCRGHQLHRRPAGRADRRRPDPAGRSRRPVVGARRRGQHRPRGHDDPRHARRRLLRLLLRAWAGILGAILFGASAACCTRSSPCSSASTTSSPVSRSTSSRPASPAFLAEACFTGLAGGGPTQSPPLPSLPTITIAAARRLRRASMEDKQWFLVSDFVSVFGVLVDRMSLLTLVALGAGRRSPSGSCGSTAFGLRLRSCGEAPVGRRDARRQRLPLQVHRRDRLRRAWPASRGAYLAMVVVQRLPGRPDRRPRLHRPGRDDLRQLAARPACSSASLLFGYTEAVQLRDGEESVHALLLLVAVVLLVRRVLPVPSQRRSSRPSRPWSPPRWRRPGWYLATDEVPREFTGMAPYVTTLLVLALRLADGCGCPRPTGRSTARARRG